MSTALLDSMTLATPAVALPAAGAATSNRALWAGRVLSGFIVLFLAGDAGAKLAGAAAAVQGTTQLGYAPHHVLTIGLLQLACLVLYLIPRTAPLGAVLLTGYLGGAIATHVRLDNPLLSHQLFPLFVAAFVWGGLYLRDARVRALLRPAR